MHIYCIIPLNFLRINPFFCNTPHAVCFAVCLCILSRFYLNVVSLLIQSLFILLTTFRHIVLFSHRLTMLLKTSGDEEKHAVFFFGVAQAPAAQ